MESRIFNEYVSVFNNYVANHPKGDVLQTTYWGQLKETTGWKYYPLAVTEGNRIQASALILHRATPIPGLSFFYSPRGPLFSSIEALHALFAAGKELAQDKKAVLWKMDPPILAGDSTWKEISPHLEKVDTGLDFSGVQPKFIMDLNINKPLPDILDGMKSKTRYNIRYASRKNVKVIASKRKSDLNIFYPILLETAKRDNFRVRAFSYFENLWDCLVENKAAQLFMAYYDGEPLAGTIAFRLGDRAWYVYGASSNNKRNLQPTYALQWEMIRWAKGCGCSVYDFRGVSGDMDPDNPLYGLFRFKDGFGAQVREYVGEYDLKCNTIGYALWRKLLPVYSYLRKR